MKPIESARQFALVVSMSERVVADFDSRGLEARRNGFSYFWQVYSSSCESVFGLWVTILFRDTLINSGRRTVLMVSVFGCGIIDPVTGRFESHRGQFSYCWSERSSPFLTWESTQEQNLNFIKC